MCSPLTSTNETRRACASLLAKLVHDCQVPVPVSVQVVLLEPLPGQPRRLTVLAQLPVNDCCPFSTQPARPACAWPNEG
eukprot:5478577-Amphidinium_carterae.1